MEKSWKYLSEPQRSPYIIHKSALNQSFIQPLLAVKSFLFYICNTHYWTQDAAVTLKPQKQQTNMLEKKVYSFVAQHVNSSLQLVQTLLVLFHINTSMRKPTHATV